MSFSRSGQGAVNSVGKCHFGKWYLHQTSEKMDAWKKPVVDPIQDIMVVDGYIRIIRQNIDVASQKFEYSIFFVGEANFLREHFKSFRPEYEDHTTKLEFESIQAAKDYIDKFIERLDNLIAFI